MNYKAVTICYGIMMCIYMVAPMFSVLVPVYGCNAVNSFPYINVAHLCNYVARPLNEDPPLILSLVGLLSSTTIYLAYVRSRNGGSLVDRIRV